MKKIIWAPDKHLGRYVQKQTGADILCWQGACIVHDEFKTQALTRLQEEYRMLPYWCIQNHRKLL